MKNYEFNNFINAVKEAFPKFNPYSDVILAGWKQALGDATLDEAKAAVVRYVAEKSSKFEPQPKEISDILDIIRKNRGYVTHSTDEKVEMDYDIKYQKLDKENGEMNWLVPHYSEVWRLIQQDRFPFVQNIYHPTHEEFRECMRRWCMRRHGRENFCMSVNQIAQMPAEVQDKMRADAIAVIKGGVNVKMFGQKDENATTTIVLEEAGTLARMQESGEWYEL